MLDYKQALEKILKHSFTLKARSLPLREALGLVAAQNIFSREPFPSFDNSAVDGYAIRLRSSDGGQGLLRFARNDVPKGTARNATVIARRPQGQRSNLDFKFQGEVRAGEIFKEGLKSGHAIRIFTGAPVPRGTQAVVMQEHTEQMNGHVSLLELPKLNDNIRFRGEDFPRGTILVRKGTLLGPTHLALFATAGYKKIPVYPSAKIAILATGSELLRVGERLKPGKIRDSNTILLEALVEKTGGIPRLLPPVEDDPAKIRLSVRKGLANDILLISGGVSVGAYDFVKDISREEGVQEIFWKVDIKPGKPIFFGKKNRTLVFGLPGNPVSVFVTFQEFVRPAIFKMMGKNPQMEGERVEGYLTKPFQNGSRLHFVRVHCVRGRKGYAITPLKGQGSHMIGSLATSNGILRVEPHRLLRKNERVSIKII